jgi:glutamine amidotransferase
MKPIVIIDYGAGNLRSVQKAFEHVGHNAVFTSDPDALKDAPAIVFPGQGASPPAMVALERAGMDDAVRDAIKRGTPFFGVCLGLQLLLEWSEEGDTRCLGVVPGSVKRFTDGAASNGPRGGGLRSAALSGSALKVPHMGWNAVDIDSAHPVFEGVPPGSNFYFVHSYYAAPTDDSWVAGRTTYGVEFASVVARDNLIATQFHPEKSGAIGLRLYDNFVRRFVAAGA